jgi:hypothetical protein
MIKHATNPYLVLRHFRVEESNLFFGRAREVDDLTKQLLGERVVTLYGPPGVGKTSLIMAGLIPRLQQAGFKVLPVVCSGLESLPGFNANRLVRSLLQRLEDSVPERVTPVDLDTLTLSEYLSQRWPSDKVVLIFDQFEEILSIDPGDVDSKRDFFEQLGIALRDGRCRIMLVVREKFVAELQPYLSGFSTGIASYHLQFLDWTSAIECIRGPAESAGIPFTDAAAAMLIDELRRVRIVNKRGELSETLSEYADPMLLQMICYLIWEKLPPNATRIDTVDVQAAGVVNGILERHYAEAVSGATNETGVPERTIREWFERDLIAPAETRPRVMLEEAESRGMTKEAIHALVGAYLVRSGTDRGRIWYELTHDRLIEPIRADNAAWFEANLAPLQRASAQWYAQEGPLFDAMELVSIQGFNYL